MSPPSPEDGNIFSFRNSVFSNFLEYRTMDKGQKTSNSECYTTSSNNVRMINSGLMRRVVPTERTGEIRSSHGILFRKPYGKIPLGIPRRRCKDNVKTVFKN
jgi:hypothetical protein